MEGLIIGYDGKRAVANNTGLGNYSRYVIDTLSIGFPRNTYRLYSPTLRENPRLEPLLMRANVELSGPSSAFGRRFGSLWRSVGITRQLNADDISLYHGLSNELPLNIARAAFPSVVTIHDLIYRRVPEDYKPVDRAMYDYKYSRAAENATRVIAISRKTRDDLVEDYQIDPAKIDIIYQGCDPRFGLSVVFEEKERVRAAYRLPKRYFISVGTVQSRKNQMLAVKALERLDLPLVIVGNRKSDYAAEVAAYIMSHGLTDKVLWLDNVPFADLPALYAMAEFSSYTSRYEGFGIPVIESLSTGTPVIAATGSCLEEAGGPGAVYVDPDDVDGFVENGRRMSGDRIFHDKYAEKGRHYVKRFSADEFARLTMACYRKAIIEKII
ncbi:MAG: glycosyltransferase family 4 protein [Muribaculaceae bacterium]|nr:glycosyltransferase family 4 protein [Muribaculaceae bacterium]